MRYFLTMMLVCCALTAAEPGSRTQALQINVIKLADGRIVAAKTAYGLDGKWITDYKRALASAKANDKLILADFTGSDWCPWCVKLKKEVFSDPKFKAWAKGRVILLELDFPRRKRQSASLKAQNQKLAQHYHIRGFPTVLVLDKRGKVLRQWGYFPGGFGKWVDGLTKDAPALESLKRD